MKEKVLLAGLLGSLSVVLALRPGDGVPFGMEGTYRLVSRDLADGTALTPPAIQGMLTYTEEYRNFNIYWTGPDGKRFSIAYVAEYELTEDTYTETSIYHMVNDEIGGAGLTYHLSPETGSAPVTRGEGTISMKLPLWDEPSVVFDSDGLTATREGAFVDHWERVD